MRLHRFIGPFDLSHKEISITDKELRNQWRNVLRLVTGDKLIVCDGQGQEAEATITEMRKDETILAIETVTTPSREPAHSVTLYISLLRRENFEIVVQKATEIGITRIVPLLTTRTVKTGFNQERLEKIIREAAEQSGRTVLPTLSSPVEFIEAIAHVTQEPAILFDLSGTELAPGSPLSTQNIFIGPEGGFTEIEVTTARNEGIRVHSLGCLTFRAETAAIIASFLAVH